MNLNFFVRKKSHFVLHWVSMKRIVLTALVLLFSVGTLGALSALQFDAGLLYIGNSEPDSGPSPLLPVVGMTFPILDHPFLLWESGFLVYATYYQYSNDRATPTEVEYRDLFWVPGLLLDTRFGLDLDIAEAFDLGIDVGLVLLLRLPVPLFDDTAGDWAPTTRYFYDQARFLYPETEIFARFAVLKNLQLKTTLRAYWPAFNLWSGENLPLADQFMLGVLLGFVYQLK